MQAAIAQVAKSCAVRLEAGAFVGSGFFVAPQTVATCAHVVGSRTQMTVEWQGQRLDARVVRSQPEQRGSGDYWAFPDLAVLAIEDPIAHPVAWLDEDPPVPGDILQAYGFSQKTAQSGVQADGLQVVVASEAGDYWRVKDDQIVGGLSGCLAVNERTGLVAGVVKASRDQGNALGGWIVPASQVRSLLSAGTAPRRFDDEWLRALLAPLMPIFEAYQLTSQMLPYKLLDGPTPPLGQIYVRQQAADSEPVDVQDAINSRLHSVFIGPPGSGKSSLVQHICGEAARWWLHPAGDPPYGLVIPVPLSAAELSGGGPLAEVLATETTAELGAYLDVELPASLFVRPPAPGVRWLLMVDGLDEVLDAEKRSQLIKMLEHRIRSEGDTWRFVITTRPMFSIDLQNLIDAAGGSFRLLPFDEQRITAFAEAWFRVRDPAHAEERTASFLAQASSPPLTGAVSIPLLATIAAIVFESHPERGLPADVSGLYSEFIRFLLVERRRQVAEDGLRSRLESFGAAGEELSGWMAANIEQLLARTASRWFFDSQMPVIDVAQEVLSALHPSQIFSKPSWRPALYFFLTETGLLVASSDRLDWIHLSFVEYLAARELVTRSRPSKWLWLAYDSTTANLARFGLAEQLAGRRIPIRSLRKFATGWRGGSMIGTLVSSGELLSDEQIDTLLGYALRSVVRNRKYPGLQPDLKVYLSRPAGVRALRSVVGDRRRLTFARIAAANALLSHDVAADQLFAARSLLSFAGSRRASVRNRIAAAAELAGRPRTAGPPPASATETAAPAELTVMEDRASEIVHELIQRRMLWAGRWFANLKTARPAIPESLEREMLHRLLASRSIGIDARIEAVERLLELGDVRGISWLVGSARRSFWMMLGLLLVILALIGTGLMFLPGLLFGLYVLELTPILFLVWRAATRRNRELAQINEGRYMRSERWSLVDEALASSGWKRERRRLHIRVPGFDHLRKSISEAWRANSPDVLLDPVTTLYDAGRNEEADHELRMLWRRIGPVQMMRIARYACKWTRVNPRSARPLLTAILKQKLVSPFRRRKIKRLLEVLGGQFAS